MPPLLAVALEAVVVAVVYKLVDLLADAMFS